MKPCNHINSTIKSIIKNLLFAYFLLLLNNINSQETPTIIGPSPTASSLSIYGSHPVNLYSGTISVSVPLFKINSGNVDLPIELNYHGSGIKVSQEASWVGLGWSLSAGGVITRQIRGLDDFNSSKAQTNDLPEDVIPDLIDWDAVPIISGGYEAFNYELWERLKSVSDGLSDGENDIYHYNFMGYSGKFMFNERSKTVKSLDENNLKFSFISNSMGFEVTDIMGRKYSFQAMESSTLFTDEYIFDLNTNISNIPDDLANSYSPPSITAWYITKITDLNDNEITFSYSNTRRVKEVVNASETEYNNTGSMRLLTYTLGDQLARYTVPQKIISYSMLESDEINLERIDFNNGYLQFTPEDRLDIRTAYLHPTSNQKPKRLKSIELFNKGGESIKKVFLNYSYFNQEFQSDNNAYKKLRLKLDSVQETSSAFSKSNYLKAPPYKFKYNTIALPDKNSLSIDHWGFYNNTKNKYLIPSYSYLYNGQIKKVAERADRDAHFPYSKAGILNEVRYPTGGSTEFNFESNKYKESIFNNDSPTLQEVTLAEMSVLFGNGSKTEEFTVNNSSCNLRFNIGNEFYYDNPSPYPNESITNIKIFIERERSDGSFEILEEFSTSIDDFSYSENFQDYSFGRMGKHRVRIDMGKAVHLGVYLKLSAMENISNPTSLVRQGGGLRIESIINKDSDGLFLTKKQFRYSPFSPSEEGILMNNLKYTTYINQDVVPSGYDSGKSIYFIANSNNFLPPKLSSQAVVGYGSVLEEQVDKNGQSSGSILYSYYNFEYGDFSNDPLDPFFPGLNIPEIEINGLLQSKTYKNSSGEVIKNTVNEYEIDTSSLAQSKNIKIFKLKSAPDFAFNVQYYKTYMRRYRLSKSVENEFDSHNDVSLSKKITFQYENDAHRLPTKLISKNSKGINQVTKIKYPQDIQNPPSSVRKLIDQNRLGEIVEEKQFYDRNNNGVEDAGELLNIVKNEYKIWSDNVVQPEKIKTAKKLNSLEDGITYHNYDTFGNPLEISKANGPHIYYLWGYNGQYPVAKIENATRSQVLATGVSETILNSATSSETQIQDELDMLRQGLPYSMVTTYTYKPLVGMTSMTDPKGHTTYYKYDDFNRLENISNDIHELISDYRYGYKFDE